MLAWNWLCTQGLESSDEREGVREWLGVGERQGEGRCDSERHPIKLDKEFCVFVNTKIPEWRRVWMRRGKEWLREKLRECEVEKSRRGSADEKSLMGAEGRSIKLLQLGVACGVGGVCCESLGIWSRQVV